MLIITICKMRNASGCFPVTKSYQITKVCKGVANLSDVLNLRTLGVHAPEPDTAVSGGDCDQT